MTSAMWFDVCVMGNLVYLFVRVAMLEIKLKESPNGKA